jgi:hypothetical protein
LVIAIGFAWSCIFLPLVWANQPKQPPAVGRAIIGMALGLMVIWVLGGGSMQLLLLRQNWLPSVPQGWVATRFALSATVLALLEEAVATTMTNLAEPVWNVSPHKAFITASTNYLEVVLLHSVVVFIPMFVVWGRLLRRYDFHPLWVHVLFGITGTLSEVLSFGPAGLMNFGLWVNVYGLMVHVPASRVVSPGNEERRTPHPCMYPAAVVLPLLAAVPVALVVLGLHRVLGMPSDGGGSASETS